MGWQKLDHTKFDTFGTGRSPHSIGRDAFRVYGLDGQEWPRLTLRVIVEEAPALVPLGFHVRAVTKNSPNDFWEASSIPFELWAEVPQLLADFKAVMDVWQLRSAAVS